MNEKAEITADMVKNLSILLMEKDKDMTMKEALSTVFQSDTYQKLMNEKTHFYHQSPRYVFAFLEEELLKGKFE